jgi:peptide/nickel transport system ATP-binding protein
MNLLDVRGLTVWYETREGYVRAVEEAWLNIKRGEVVGLVGESGCGKTTLAMAIMGILPHNAKLLKGQLLLDGEDLTALSEAKLRELRWRTVSMVFQGAMNALNPVLSVGEQIAEVLIEKAGMEKPQAYARAAELLELVGISRSRLRDYPHQLSGGMKQRVAIAMAMACGPKLLIADEPVTGLDVVSSRKVIDILKRLAAELGTSVLIISHDLPTVSEACSRIYVMYAGRIVESGSTRDILAGALHPYTRGLLASLPRLTGPKLRVTGIPGTPPNLLTPPAGCMFHPRCPLAQAVCVDRAPELQEVVAGRYSACHFSSTMLQRPSHG